MAVLIDAIFSLLCTHVRCFLLNSHDTTEKAFTRVFLSLPHVLLPQHTRSATKRSTGVILLPMRVAEVCTPRLRVCFHSQLPFFIASATVIAFRVWYCLKLCHNTFVPTLLLLNACSSSLSLGNYHSTYKYLLVLKCLFCQWWSKLMLD